MKTFNRWTEKDINVLRNYSEKGIGELIKRLPGRSKQAIRTKCSYLNLDIGETNIIIERLFTL